MGELAQAYVQIIPSARGIKGKLTELLGGDAEKAGITSGHVFSNALSGAAKIGVSALATATATAAAGVTALVKSSVSGYADYEQLIGGVETLFGEISKTTDASAEVVKNAGNAYKTAGLSASEYMETATSFAASLMASLEYDGAAAAKAADQAVTDMADNANKMGTSMESIQNAYQGFAKQNYTMLDNLKLGYGGTKTEMERLLADAQKISGIEYNIDNLSDVYEAIHVIQTELGITGTTAKEASTTISGSIAATKAAWSNLVVGIADDNQDFSALVDNFVDSVSTAGQNILPRVETAIKGVGQLIEQLLPVVVQEIPQLINDVLPDLLQSGVNMVDSLMQGLLQNMGTISEGASEILVTLVDGILSLLPELAVVGIQLLAQLAEGIGSALPELIPVAIESILGLVDALIGNADLLIDGAIALIEGLVDGLVASLPILMEYIPEIIDGILNLLITEAPMLIQASAEIIVTLANGLIENLPTLIALLPELVVQIVGGLIEAAPALLEAGKEFIVNVEKALNEAWSALIKSIPELVGNLVKAYLNLKEKFNQVGTDFITKIKSAIVTKWNEIVRAVGGWVNSLISGFKNKASEFLDIGTQFIDKVKSGIESTWDNIVSSVSGWVGNLKTNFINNVANFTDIGANIVSGIKNGIVNGWNDLEDFAKQKAKSLLSAAKKALGIKSPSTLFRDEVGKWIPAGIAVGIDKNSSLVSKAIEEAVTSGMPSINNDVNTAIRSSNIGNYADSISDTYGRGRQNIQEINQNFYFDNSVEGPEEMARAARIEAKYGLVKGVPIGH